jgi:hypothetical protein
LDHHETETLKITWVLKQVQGNLFRPVVLLHQGIFSITSTSSVGYPNRYRFREASHKGIRYGVGGLLVEFRRDDASFSVGLVKLPRQAKVLRAYPNNPGSDA